MTYKIKDGKLFIDDCQVGVPGHVFMATDFELGSVIIAIFDTVHGTPQDNVLAFDSGGKLLWQIEPCTSSVNMAVLTPEQRRRCANPYINLSMLPDGTYQASTWNGSRVNIDITTGKIVEVVRGPTRD